LAPIKEIAQLGATIGREFSYNLLTLVSPLPDYELQDALLCSKNLADLISVPEENRP
jgi:hypothetical protein